MSASSLLSVRPLHNRDRAEWEPLWKACRAFYGVEVETDVTETTWSRLIFDSDSPFGLVAMDVGGSIVGLAHYVFHASTWTVGQSCYLEDLFVAPRARGGGIGRALVEAVYDAADQADTAEVYLLAQDFNIAARRLYDEVAEKTDFIKYRR